MDKLKRYVLISTIATKRPIVHGHYVCVCLRESERERKTKLHNEYGVERLLQERKQVHEQGFVWRPFIIALNFEGRRSEISDQIACAVPVLFGEHQCNTPRVSLMHD